MATSDDLSMISSASSISNGNEPQLPPLPPPLQASAIIRQQLQKSYHQTVFSGVQNSIISDLIN